MSRLTLVMVLILVSGCSTVSKQMQFDSSNERAFAVATFYTGQRPASSSYTFVLRQVDPNDGTVLPDKYIIRVKALGDTSTDEMIKSVGSKSGIYMAGKLLPAGRFFVSKAIYSAPMLSRVYRNCMNRFSPVFDLSPGTIHILPLPTPRVEVISEEVAILTLYDLKTLESRKGEVLSSFEQRRKYYRGMTAAAEFTSPVGIARFEVKEGNFLIRSACNAPDKIDMSMFK